jgi:hypothetical protein
MDFSVPMALVDFIPVALFAVASVILMRDLYDKMSKGAFALFAAGTIDVACAGALKALYKLLYALGVCDFEPLTKMFFPVQSIGFLLAGIGVLAMVCHRQTEKAAFAVAPPLFSGTFIFIGLMVTGLCLLDVVLCYLSAKLKKPRLILLFVLSFVCSLAMGYLATKDFAVAAFNWIAEGVNVVGQGAFLAGAILLRKAGLPDLKLNYKD